MSLGRRCCGASALKEGLADALVDDFDRRLIGQARVTRSRQLRLLHGGPVGNDQKRSPKLKELKSTLWVLGAQHVPQRIRGG